MILDSLTLPAARFEEGTGWTLKPQGACRGEVCVPLPDVVHDGQVDVAVVAERLGMPLVESAADGLWSLGPASLGGGVPERVKAIFAEADKIQVDRAAYVRAVRDWVEFGSASRFVLPPDEVIARSGRRDQSAAEGAAHFELGQYLWRAGRGDVAVEHFRAAHRLQPENFSYKRQAWSLVPAGAGAFDRFWQGPVKGREGEWPYDSDWLSEVREKGAENYYPEMEP